MSSGVPEDANAFNQLMEQIDRRLRSEGLDIAKRPLHALRLLASQFHIPLPLAEPPPQMEASHALYWPVSKRAYDWYDRRYGDRLKMDFTLGKIVVRLDGDIWSVIVPRLVGSGMFVALRPRTRPHKGLYNILDMVEGMTDEHRTSLSADALDSLDEFFHAGLQALSILDASRNRHRLLAIAHEDAKAAVLHMVGRIPEYGSSRWASLQVAEKTIKATIALLGGSFSETHSLDKLAGELGSVLPTANIAALVPHIQCSARVRYGQENSSQDQALAAHLGSLRLIGALGQAGAPLLSGISARP